MIHPYNDNNGKESDSRYNRRGLEMIDDNEGPPNTIPQIAALLESTKGLSSSGKRGTRRPAGIEEMDDTEAPLSRADVEESFGDAISKKLFGSKSNTSSVPINEHENDGPQTPSGGSLQAKLAATRDQQVVEEEPNTEDTAQNNRHTTESIEDSTPTNDVEDPSVLCIPEAFLVEYQDEIPVYDAVQVSEPCWKRHRLLTGSIVAISVTAIIVAIVGGILATNNKSEASNRLNQTIPNIITYFITTSY